MQRTSRRVCVGGDLAKQTAEAREARTAWNECSLGAQELLSSGCLQTGNKNRNTSTQEDSEGVAEGHRGGVRMVQEGSLGCGVAYVVCVDGGDLERRCTGRKGVMVDKRTEDLGEIRKRKNEKNKVAPVSEEDMNAQKNILPKWIAQKKEKRGIKQNPKSELWTIWHFICLVSARL
jgi:hypothetical protein